MILCCGEALIDMIPIDTGNGVGALQPHTGGAVYNTAIALGRLGVNAGFCSGISDDLFGQMLRSDLENNNVNTEFVIESSRPTTLAFVHLVDGQANYVFYDENTAGRMITLADFPKDLRSVEALFFGGISLISKPAANAYQQFCQQSCEEKLVYLDPNIRPGFVNDEAEYRNRLDSMIGEADIVKFSDEDLSWMYGDRSTDQAIGDLLDRGPKMVLVTRGAKGAVCHYAREAIQCPAPKVAVVDTVGAGDTFNAGFLSSMDEQDLLTKSFIERCDRQMIYRMLQKGVQAAAVTVGRAGANPPYDYEL